MLKLNGFIVLLLCALFLSVSSPSLSALEGTLVLVGTDEWMHVSIGGTRIESVAWDQFGSEVQYYFFSFNDSAVMFDQFVVTANSTVDDPLDKFLLSWDGSISNGKIVWTVASPLGPVSTVVESFAFGERPQYGRPAMTSTKTVITRDSDLYDVVVEEKHAASFEWTMVTLYDNATELNQTFPQLTVYNPDGSTFDTKVLTTPFVPLVEYYDQVGFMMESMGQDWVKWILYSGVELAVRLSRGFGSLALPFFSVDPQATDVYPGEPITLTFILPKGVTEYSVNLVDDVSLSKYVEILEVEQYHPSSQEHTLAFCFVEQAENMRITAQVKALKYGTTYESNVQFTVLVAQWKTMLLPTVVGVGAVVFIVVILWYVNKWRKVPPTAAEALRQEGF